MNPARGVYMISRPPALRREGIPVQGRGAEGNEISHRGRSAGHDWPESRPAKERRGRETCFSFASFASWGEGGRGQSRTRTHAGREAAVNYRNHWRVQQQRARVSLSVPLSSLLSPLCPSLSLSTPLSIPSPCLPISSSFSFSRPHCSPAPPSAFCLSPSVLLGTQSKFPNHERILQHQVRSVIPLLSSEADRRVLLLPCYL